MVDKNSIKSKKDFENLILKEITDFYLNSRDFNGLPAHNIPKDILASLIRKKKISLVFNDVHPNPHIKAFDEESEEKQIEKIEKLGLGYACVYPSRGHLKKVVDQSKYQGRPFTLRLALGEPQLSFVPFDLTVLESYRNDPRYYYDSNDISGRIYVRDEYNGSNKLPSRDRVFLQTFGFCYDSHLNRAVGVYLVYLSTLSPEHQQIWNAKVLNGKYNLHPDYYRTSVLGKWPDGISTFDAFAEELHHINEICKLMGRPLFFKKELRERDKPKQFCFLIRPTLKEFNEFVHILDKSISENINRKFFLKDIALEDDKVRGDGKVVVQQKGTIQLLSEWLSANFVPVDRRPLEEMIHTFKEIRRLRQVPAHCIDEDVFDQKYIKEQRELIKKAFDSIRTLRLIFMSHPSAKGYEIPKWYQSNKIWIY